MKKSAQREILDNFFDSKEEMQVLKKLYSEWQRLSMEQDEFSKNKDCLLYTSDAADDSLRVDLGGRRIIKKHGFT